MSPSQKKESQPFPECLPKNKQDGASRQQIKEYNTLAKKYNEMDSFRMRILKSDVERLEFIYGLMSDKQKADAEPFPDFPEPPPAPKAPIGLTTNVESPLNFPAPPRSLKAPPSLNTANYADQQLKEIIENQDPYDVAGPANVAVPSPSLPPEPIKPIDYVIAMAKKGATFLYEEKEISSDRAIELLKKNTELHIESRTKNGNTIVRITKDPVTRE